MSKTISDINDAMLNRQADRIKELEQECDQFRKDVKMLRDALKRFLSYGNVFAYRKSDTNPYIQAEEAIAATEPKE